METGIARSTRKEGYQLFLFVAGEAFALEELFVVGEAFALEELFVVGEAFALEEVFVVGEAFALEELFVAGEAFALELFLLLFIVLSFVANRATIKGERPTRAPTKDPILRHCRLTI